MRKNALTIRILTILLGLVLFSLYIIIGILMERVERYESYVNRDEAKETLLEALVNYRETSGSLETFSNLDYRNKVNQSPEIQNAGKYINFLIINHNNGKTIAKSDENVVLERNFYVLASFDFKGENVVIYVQNKQIAFNFSDTMILFYCIVTLFLVCIVAIIIILISLFKKREDDLMRDNFFHNITHEFKTPITTIGIANERLKKLCENSPENALKMISIINDENRKIKTLVDHILQFGSFERDITDIPKEATHVHQAIEEVLEEFKLIFDTKLVRVNFRFDAENDIIKGNLIFLKIVIANLVDNAVKYSKERPEIKISTISNDSQIIISIADNGIGMAKKNLKKVFKKMYRIKNKNHIKGFGLGLFFVKQIVTHFEGSISAQSENGKGSTFTMVFPLIENTKQQ